MKDFPLKKMRIPNSNIYLIGYKANQVSVYAQQVRALDLIYELAYFLNNKSVPHSDGAVAQGNAPSLAHKRIAVIGAGAAGLTAAAAADALGAEVFLLEEQATPMHLQRGCFTRYLHPQVYSWPERSALVPASRLPLLGWSADVADAVRDQIVDQFFTICNQPLSKVQSLFEVQISIEIEEEKKDIRKWYIEARQKATSESSVGEVRKIRNLDAIVLALGFGIERTLDLLPRHSYWRMDSLDQSHLDSTDNPYTILVAGAGDGGILDVLRAALTGFDHGPFFDRCMLIMKDEKFLKAIEDIEIAAHITHEKTENLTAEGAVAEMKHREEKVLADGYEKLEKEKDFKAIFEELDAYLKRSLHPGSKVVWVSSLPYPPHSTKTMALNRMLIWRLHKLCVIKHIQGRVQQVSVLNEQTKPGGFRYAVKLDGDLTLSLGELCHRVILRIGGDDVLMKSFPAIAKVAKDKLSPAPQAHLETNVFETFWKLSRKEKTDVCLAAFCDPVTSFPDPNKREKVYRVILYVKYLPSNLQWVEYELQTKWGLIRRRARQLPPKIWQSLAASEDQSYLAEPETLPYLSEPAHATWLAESFPDWSFPSWIYREEDESKKDRPMDCWIRVHLSNGHIWEEQLSKALANHIDLERVRVPSV